jgi:hypothetical protein
MFKKTDTIVFGKVNIKIKSKPLPESYENIPSFIFEGFEYIENNGNF